MAIHELKKQSDLEKRLQLLRRQVYGKEVAGSKYYVARENQKNSHTTNYQLPTSDLTYLYQDLLKIGVLSALALGIQIILFFLSKNHLLNLNLF